MDVDFWKKAVYASYTLSADLSLLKGDALYVNVHTNLNPHRRDQGHSDRRMNRAWPQMGALIEDAFFHWVSQAAIAPRILRVTCQK